MKSAAIHWKHARLAYIIVIGCLILYATASLLAPATANVRYHLSEPQLLLLRLTILLPVHIIWVVAIYGTIHLKHYATMLGSSPEAPSYHKIANGLLLTVAYFISGTLIASLLPFITHWSGYESAVIIRDHLPAILALVAFFLVYRGSHELRLVASFTTWTQRTIWILIGFSLFAVLFVLDFATAPSSSPTVATNSLTILPHSLLLATLVLPYLAGWFLGILACINITKYANGVKGVLYRKALRHVVWGIWCVIILGALSQIVTFAVRFFTSLNIGVILLIVYSLLILYGIGFLFIRSGAKRLIRIEAAQ